MIAFNALHQGVYTQEPHASLVVGRVDSDLLDRDASKHDYVCINRPWYAA